MVIKTAFFALYLHELLKSLNNLRLLIPSPEVWNSPDPVSMLVIQVDLISAASASLGYSFYCFLNYNHFPSVFEYELTSIR